MNIRTSAGAKQGLLALIAAGNGPNAPTSASDVSFPGAASEAPEQPPWS